MGGVICKTRTPCSGRAQETSPPNMDLVIALMLTCHHVVLVRQAKCMQPQGHQAGLAWTWRVKAELLRKVRRPVKLGAQRSMVAPTSRIGVATEGATYRMRLPYCDRALAIILLCMAQLFALR